MARKQIDHAAAKAKKQKTMLVVMGVVLLGLGAIQGPKLWKQLNPPAAAPAAASAPPVASVPGSPASSTAPASPAAPAQAGTGPRAVLAGVTIVGAAAPRATEGQLRSFSLFEAKDPFVQQQSDVSAAPAATPAPAPSAGAPAGAGGDLSGGVTVAPAGSAPATPAQPALTNATIVINGSPQALSLRDTFPKSDPMFVLVSLKKGTARIGVAGGTFAGGKTIALKLDKQVTLVNDATGARYAVKLVYLGAAPEKIESFTAPAPSAAAAPTSVQK
ncbi:hypothetical protein Gocc_2700 [Gaiella occulta]|uniref:Uncharacterized protein n=1 Tax=Gaiella occulta TaxID=1002870 RepID=A0A7M2YVE3_9ACTN|nr:hypothetical protein [Gaiella occulta]RDI73559.1 hypothetical protein Gocc_2700 [Gaiella occulta]